MRGHARRRRRRGFTALVTVVTLIGLYLAASAGGPEQVEDTRGVLVEAAAASLPLPPDGGAGLSAGAEGDQVVLDAAGIEASAPQPRRSSATGRSGVVAGSSTSSRQSTSIEGSGTFGVSQSGSVQGNSSGGGRSRNRGGGGGSGGRLCLPTFDC